MGTHFVGDVRTPAVDVVTWFLLVVAMIAVLIRLGTKLWIFRQLHKDDYIMILSAVRSNTDCLFTGSHSLEETGADNVFLCRSLISAKSFVYRLPVSTAMVDI